MSFRYFSCVRIKKSLAYKWCVAQYITGCRSVFSEYMHFTTDLQPVIYWATNYCKQDSISEFLAIKIACWWYSTKNAQILQSYKAVMYSHPIQTKANGIIFVVQILAREFYMPVLILIFSKWNPRYNGNGRTLALKTWETETRMVYSNFPKFKPNP